MRPAPSSTTRPGSSPAVRPIVVTACVVRSTTYTRSRSGSAAMACVPSRVASNVPPEMGGGGVLARVVGPNVGSSAGKVMPESSAGPRKVPPGPSMGGELLGVLTDDWELQAAKVAARATPTIGRRPRPSPTLRPASSPPNRLLFTTGPPSKETNTPWPPMAGAEELGQQKRGQGYARGIVRLLRRALCHYG